MSAAINTNLPPINACQYKIDVSTDGNNHTTVLDQTTNVVKRNTLFEEISPAKCRFVRLTMLNWPRPTPLGIIEFTVFGKPAESLPAAVPVPVARWEYFQNELSNMRYSLAHHRGGEQFNR